MTDLEIKEASYKQKNHIQMREHFSLFKPIYFIFSQDSSFGSGGRAHSQENLVMVNAEEHYWDSIARNYPSSFYFIKSIYLLWPSLQKRGKELLVIHTLNTFQKNLQAVGIEPTTFCVLSRCDNHYTTAAMDHHATASHVLYSASQSVSNIWRLFGQIWPWLPHNIVLGQQPFLTSSAHTREFLRKFVTLCATQR